MVPKKPSKNFPTRWQPDVWPLVEEASRLSSHNSINDYITTSVIKESRKILDAWELRAITLSMDEVNAILDVAPAPPRDHLTNVLREILPNDSDHPA